MIRVLAAALVACTAIAGCRSLTAVPVSEARTPWVRVPSVDHPVTGVVTYDLAAFDRHCGCQPGLAIRYTPWGNRIPTLDPTFGLGATPVVELEPYSASLASIVAGHQDKQIAAYAKVLRAYAGTVLVSFAPEANTSGVPWGRHYDTPAVWVAAWRHVVSTFRRDGVPNVRFIWVVNAISPHTTALSELWPGSEYVDYAGIDGYFTSPDTTFSNLFGSTIAQIRQLASVPILITEAAADQQAGKTKAIAQITAAVPQYKLAGFAWFSINQLNGLDPGAPQGNRHDWSLEDDSSALSAFSAAARDARG